MDKKNYLGRQRYKFTDKKQMKFLMLFFSTFQLPPTSVL